MTPDELGRAAGIIHGLWPDALIWPNPPAAPNGYQRHPEIPIGCLLVDLDRVWPHECEGDDCNECCGWYELVAWIDGRGNVHFEERAKLAGA